MILQRYRHPFFPLRDQHMQTAAENNRDSLSKLNNNGKIGIS